jgi:hypothetical protein
MVLITPLMLLIMLATAEVTRAFVDHNTLTKAVRNGVRYVAENAFQGTTGIVFVSTQLRGEAKNLVVYGNTLGVGSPVLPGLTPADITITDLGGDNIQISVSFTITGMLGPVVPNFFGSSIDLLHNLQASVTMRAL